MFELQGVMRCDQGHSFDIARQGYVNLLTGSDVERGIAGDSRAMLHARRRFLNAGHFDPLLDLLKSEVDEALFRATGADNADKCVLEVGCGEGFYIGNMADSAPVESMGAATSVALDSPLEGVSSKVHYIGMDVSKDAVRLAAGRYRSARFAVANARRRLYVSTGSVNVLLSIFAPRNEAEFRRVLDPVGTLIVAIPGPVHMEHVRSAYDLMDMEAAKEERVLEQFGEHFVLEARRKIEYPLLVTPDGVRDYISMGPNARHTNLEDISADGEIRTEASFVVLRLGRHTYGLRRYTSASS